MRAALVPVKRLGAAKSRLLGPLDRAGLDALTLAMLADVLGALRATPEVDHIAVVTPDRDVAGAARAEGAHVLVETRVGLNPSLDSAGEQLAAKGAGSLLVLLGDVACVCAADISRLYRGLEELGGRGAVLAAARDGGTAALLRAPPDVLPNRFGAASAARHREAAGEAAVPFLELSLDSLRLDLDRPEDLRDLLAMPGGAERTRAVLREQGHATEAETGV